MNLTLVNHNNHFVHLHKGTTKPKDMYPGSPKLTKLIGMANMNRISKSFDCGRNPLHFECSNNNTPRVPEIQMINKLYGLVPKKFTISERIRPETAVNAANARSRSHTRPVTASKVKYTKSGHRLLANSRQGSLDLNKTNNENLSHSEEVHSLEYSGSKSKGGQINGSVSASCTPLITRRMSFEKSYLRPFKRTQLNQGANTASPEKTREDKPINQRVIHIDLNRMRWTDDDGNYSADETGRTERGSEQPDSKKNSENTEDMKPAIAASSKRSKSLRKTISFDEDALRTDKKEEKVKSGEKKSKRPSTAKQITPKKSDELNSAIEEGMIVPSATSVSEVAVTPHVPVAGVPEDVAPIPWTTGKTTAERRAKFQKSFTIHPSMDASFDSCLGFGVESESEAPTYPSTTTSVKQKTGRRSLHVESFNDDVDTLLSTTKSKDRFVEHNESYQYTNSYNNANTSQGTTGLNISACMNFSRSMSMLSNETRPSPSPSYTLTPKFPNNGNLRQQENNDGSRTEFNKMSSEERRTCLRKSMSLPEGNGVSTNASRGAGGGGHNGKNISKKPIPPLIRSTSLQHSHSKSSSGGNDFGAGTKLKHSNVSKLIIKKPILDMTQTTRLRPRTAPTNHGRGKRSVEVSDNNKRSGTSHNASSNRRQPLKALQLPMSNGIQRQNSKERDNQGGGDSEQNQKSQGHGRKLVRSDSLGSKPCTTAGMDVRKAVSWGKNVADNEKSEVKEEAEAETNQPPKRHSFKTLKNLPTYLKLLQQPRRRSISVDDDSLLKFTTASVASAEVESKGSDTTNSIVAGTDSKDTSQEGMVEPAVVSASPINQQTIATIKNIKKREECLKIYEKMSKVGCNVRLQTIFRGMMSPVEYREFMTSAEAAVQRQAKIDEQTRLASAEAEASGGPATANGNCGRNEQEADKIVEPPELQPIKAN